MRTRFTLMLIGVLAALALVAVPTVSAATNVHEAVLKGSASFPAVDGKAKFGVDDGVRELEVQIEDANRLAGQKLKVLINGVRVGTMTVGQFGNARLRKSGDSIPAVTTGSKIRVRTLDGVLVAFGKFN